MRAVLQTIRLIVLTLLVKRARCQDGYNDQDLLRAQQVANEGAIETITGYSSNVHDPNSQTITSLSVRYQMPDDASKFEFNRERGRTRKVYRIKNPYQSQAEETQIDVNNSQDNGASASNQYAGMQYSLPPEEFLQQMRADQYHQQQQQQQQQQLSTQASAYSAYTATPQPQYLYSTISAANYDNQAPQTVQDPKSFNSMYNSNSNANANANVYQYNNPNNYNLDTPHNTPAPSYLSTPNNQYSIGTQSNSYVSSSSPMYITSPPNLQPYVSSQYSNTQTGTVDYNNNRISTLGNNLQSYDNSILNKKLPVDQYGNPGSGLRYPSNSQNHYQNEFPSSTMSPVSSPYSDEMRDNWQNSGSHFNNGLASPKSGQDLALSQYPMNTHYRYNAEESKQDNRYDSINQDRHGSLGSSNNAYYNYVHPENQQQNNYKGQVREIDQQVGQTAMYSHGDYGWKLNDRKPVYGEVSTGGYASYQLNNAKSDNGAVSQVSFHMDTSRPYNYNQISKSSTEKLEAEEFARAAAKAHDSYKQQLESNRFSANNQYINNAYMNADPYYSNNDKLRNKYENPNAYTSGTVRSDYVTASPYFGRENLQDNKPKQYEQENIIKNIVSNDVSNVVQNSNAQIKSNFAYENNDKYMIAYNKDQIEQNLKQYSRPTSETYYKDKNNVYSFGIKSQPDEYISERFKQKEPISYQGKPQTSESAFGNNGYSGSKRYIDDQTHINSITGHVNEHNQENASPTDHLQRKPLSDIATLMKFNDIPLRLTHNLNADSFRLQNSNFDQSGIPNPLPVRISQNIENHHVDVATDLLNKLIASKQNSNKQEAETQNGNLLSTINGFKVANPFNIDLKLVAEMLKGKPVIDESQISSLREQYPKPIKFDLPQLQQLILKNENIGAGLGSFGTISSPYFDLFSNIRYPFQGIKYSRSEEEPENIPIAESSNSHPIGAVVEEDTTVGAQEHLDVIATEEDTDLGADDDRSLKPFNTNQRTMGDRYRHMSPVPHGRHAYQRKYPKSLIDQPYPLLKPPPSHKVRGKGFHPSDKSNRKRRVNKPKHIRFFKTEPLFEANTDLDEPKNGVSTLLKPPPVMEDKSDVVDEDEITIKEATS